MSKILLQNKDIGVIIRREIVMVLREILDDPDFGLELTEKAKKRLHRALSSKQKAFLYPRLKRNIIKDAEVALGISKNSRVVSSGVRNLMVSVGEWRRVLAIAQNNSSEQ